MSQEKVEIVKAAFDAYLRGEMESALPYVDPNIVVIGRSELPDAMPRYGHAGVVENIAAWSEQWDNFQFEIVQILEAGEEVVVRSHHRGRGKSSGVDVEDEAWYVFGFRNRKIAEWRIYGTEDEAEPARYCGDVAGERGACPVGLRRVGAR